LNDDFDKVYTKIQEKYGTTLNKPINKKNETFTMVFLSGMAIIFILAVLPFVLKDVYPKLLYDNEKYYTIVFICAAIFIVSLALYILKKGRTTEVKDVQAIEIGKDILSLMANNIWSKADINKNSITKEDYNAPLFRTDVFYFNSCNSISLDNDKIILAKVKNRPDNVNSQYYVFNGISGKIKLDEEIEGTFAISFNDVDGTNEDFKIDNNEFNSYYNIYVDDNNKVKSMELLTPDVMQKILDKVKTTKRYFDFGIEKNILYFRIYYTLDDDFYIDDEITMTNLSYDNLKIYYNYLLEIKDIIDFLNDIVNNYSN
jgi:hypothetical protein